MIGASPGNDVVAASFACASKQRSQSSRAQGGTSSTINKTHTLECSLSARDDANDAHLRLLRNLQTAVGTWALALTLGISAPLVAAPPPALANELSAPSAAATTTIENPFFSFAPVCPASDGVFRVGQRSIAAVAGTRNIEDYRPLINDVLIRVRTELCVLESFARETAVPFVQQKGLSWVLPARETSETYLAGVVFVVGMNFILLGSTKVVAVVSIYHDLALGVPTRLLGKLLGAAGRSPQEKNKEMMEKLVNEQMDEVKKVMMNGGGDQEKLTAVNEKYGKLLSEQRAKQEAAAEERASSALGKAATLASVVAVPLSVYGTASEKLRQLLEVFDTFCSRYFVAFTVFYIIIKTGHFVLFPDFP